MPRKGGDFEREVCKQLSLWWSQGDKEPREDIFWRSSISGGRATIRRKQGKRTFGHYGDIAAVDPIGEPLLRAFTIELKCGRKHGSPMDLIDCLKNDAQKSFESALVQAYDASRHAGSRGWALICRRDYKCAMIYLESEPFLEIARGCKFAAPVVRFKCLVHAGTGRDRRRMRFVGMTLQSFLRGISPERFKKLAS